MNLFVSDATKSNENHAAAITRSATRKRPINARAYVRGVVALSMLLVWGAVAFSGVLMWLAPEGQRSGRALLLFGWDKHFWGDVHLWLSLTALGLTAIHLIVDWRALCGCVRYLVRAHRAPDRPCR